jgi:hypothetical protein
MGEAAFERWHVNVNDVTTYTWTFWQAGTTLAQIAANDTTKRLNLTGLVFRLSIEWDGGSLLLITGTDAQVAIGDQTILEQRGQFSATLTAAQRALLPLDGRVIKYNIQTVEGSIKDSWIEGEIVARKWVNNA